MDLLTNGDDWIVVDLEKEQHDIFDNLPFFMSSQEVILMYIDILLENIAKLEINYDNLNNQEN